MQKPTMLEWFHYKHLPEPLRATSKQFHDLAHYLWEQAERAYAAHPHELNKAAEEQLGHALIKLCEAKDCAVRMQHALLRFGIA